MLNPTSRADRINYGAMLTPPYGYKLNKAIGTTYSLDMETLIGVAVNLGLVQDIDEEVQSDITGILAALSNTSDKMIVFCEAGQIKKSKNLRPVFSLLEKIVVPVALNKMHNGHYASFHPKFWVLQYVNSTGDFKYRIAILSRNLTFDHSWDMAVSIDGDVIGQKDGNTEKIQCFLEFLAEKLVKESNYYQNQKELINLFISELNGVLFDVEDSLFDSFEFMPLGIGKNASNIKNSLIDYGSDKLFVVSPFVSDSVVKELSKSCSYNHTLITRKSELDKLSKHNGYGFDVYVMKDEVVDGEDSLSEHGSDAEVEEIRKDIYKQDIHAKMYLSERDGLTNLYIGSVNASSNAMSHNVETMVKLKSQNYMVSYQTVRNEIIGDIDDKHCPFEEAEFSSCDDLNNEEETKEELEHIIKDICRLNRKAIVIDKGDSLYDVNVSFEQYSTDASIMLTPFLCKNAMEFCSSISFTDMNLINLSEFYVLSVSKGNSLLERIITIPTEGMPNNREQKIVRSIITTKREFVEYISFLLDENYLQALFEKKELVTSGFYKRVNVLPSLYEKMLRTAVNDPEKIEDIQHILDLLGDEDVIPDEFKNMYAVFGDVLGFEVKDK